MSDYLTYTTGPRGDLYAELPTSPTTGALHITPHRSPHRPRRCMRAAEEQRPDPASNALERHPRADDGQQAHTGTCLLTWCPAARREVVLGSGSIARSPDSGPLSGPRSSLITPTDAQWTLGRAHNAIHTRR